MNLLTTSLKILSIFLLPKNLTQKKLVQVLNGLIHQILTMDMVNNNTVENLQKNQFLHWHHLMNHNDIVTQIETQINHYDQKKLCGKHQKNQQKKYQKQQKQTIKIL